MGFFGLLCFCCSGRRRKYPDSVVTYPYAPHGQPALDPVLPIKEHVVETTTKAKEETTPPPDYSVSSLSKVQTVVSSSSDPDGISPSSSDTKKQDERKKMTTRPIKPMPKRHDKGQGYSTDDVQLGSYTKATNGQEPKSLLQTPLSASLYEKKEETTAQPFVFSSACTLPLPAEKTTASPPPLFSPSTRTKKLLPLRPKPTAPTYPSPLSLFSSSSPSSPTTATFPSRQTTAPTTLTTTTPITTTFPPPPPSPPSPSDPGLTCPKCSAPNKLLTTCSSNLNHGRPYRLCSSPSCRSWNGFSDTRGLTPSEPCWCDPPRPMRLVAMNAVDARGRRKAFFSCQYKRCRAWKEAEEEGTWAVRWFGEGEVSVMVERGEI